MTPGLLMFMGTAVVLIAVLVMLINFNRISKDPGLLMDGRSNAVAIHLASGVLTTGGGLVLIAGFLWFLVKEIR